MAPLASQQTILDLGTKSRDLYERLQAAGANADPPYVAPTSRTGGGSLL